MVVGLSLGAGGAAAAGAAAPSFLGALPPLFLRVFLKQVSVTVCLVSLLAINLI